ncbi:chaperone [Lithospermum erythrorhizon]|uniref:Chaperone n=1 Tax=Lithospermum erythrorhizon TaxID=34254 RepID=A0AAV3P0F0_LITER
MKGSDELKIKVSFDSNQLDLCVPSHFTFGDLKQVVAQELGVEPQVQKLLFRGIEKDDHDHLSMVGVKDNSKILLMVDKSLKKQNHEEVMAPNEVSIGEAAVAEVREEVDNLSGQVLALEAVIQSGTKVDEKDIVYVTEMLMRQLLKLDGIEAQGEGKLQRKIEVRRVQSLVDKMDHLKAKNSNPNGNDNSTAPVITPCETFKSGVGSPNSPTSIPTSSKVTKDWEQFD